jgi:ABC-type branched-subunit amino acid transport system substrate-binding protein
VKLTKWYDENGVDIIIGYNWGSFLDASDGESKHRGITVISPRSTSSQHRTIYPHIIKLTPLETHQARVLALAMIDLGYDKVITISKPSPGWGNGFIPQFNESYTGLGGEIVADLIVSSLTSTPAFDSSLERVEKTVASASRTFGNDSLAILATFNFVSPDSLPNISKRPGLMNVTWFGTVYLGLLPPESYSDLDVFSQLTVIQPLIDRSPYTDNPVYTALNDAYVAEFARILTRYDGALYDACWIAALSVIEAGSTLNTTLIETIPLIASEYIGATGDCSLDEYGDRAIADFILYEYMEVDEVFKTVETGRYYGALGKIEWID